MDKIIKVDQDMVLIIGVIMETIWQVTKGMGDKIIIEMDLGETIETKVMKKKTWVGHMIGKPEVLIEGTIEASVTVDWAQVSRVGTNIDSIRCLECQEYDHFARDFPNNTNRQRCRTNSAEVQYGQDQTLLQMPLMDID